MHQYSFSKSTRLNKNAQKKFLIYVLTFALAFTAYIQSERQAEAIGFAAVPAGIEIGAGVYVAGALITAGAAGLIGYDEYQDEINAHAKNVWSGANDLAKKSITESIALAQGAGTGLVNIGSDFLNWSEKQIDSMALSIADAKLSATNPNQSNFFTNNEGAFVFNGVTVYYGGAYDGKYMSVYVSQSSPGRVRLEFRSSSGSRDTYLSGTVDAWRSRINSINTLSGYLALINGTIGAEMPSMFATVYTDGFTGEYADTYNTASSQIREAWESMRDAGLVLPVDNVVGHVGDKVVDYNASSDTFTDDAGTVYNPSDIDFAFPVPKYRDTGVPVPGVYVDTPVLTGNPAIDGPITQNPAIPKTVTNINTGTTVANPDIPIEANPDIPVDPPPVVPDKPPSTTPTVPRVPGSGAPVPILIFLAFFELLRALLMYLVRMFDWIVSIPFVAEKPIDNPYFQWFRQAKILGVYPYTLVCSMATFFLGFKLVKAVRSYLP